MKKLLVILLGLAMCFALTACGNAEEGTEAESSAEETATEEAAIPETPFEFAGYATVDTATGWTIEDYDEDYSVDFKHDAGATLKLRVKTDASAEDWVHKYDENYGGGKAIDTCTINGREWHRITALDDQFIILTDLGDGNALEISVMWATYDQATPQLEAITVK